MCKQTVLNWPLGTIKLSPLPMSQNNHKSFRKIEGTCAFCGLSSRANTNCLSSKVALLRACTSTLCPAQTSRDRDCKTAVNALMTTNGLIIHLAGLIAGRSVFEEGFHYMHTLVQLVRYPANGNTHNTSHTHTIVSSCFFCWFM